jgi:hypothetical protein
MDNSLTAALELAAKGFAVFPIRKNEKRPACLHGAKDATTNPDDIRNLFDGEYGEYNIGIEASRSDLILIDCDCKDGRDGKKAMDALVANYGKFTPTRAAKTPSSGLHLYYRAPAGPRLPNIKDHPLIGVGIEVKSENQYLVAPPSQIGDKQYAWINPSQEIADCPSWLAELCRKTVEKPAEKPVEKSEPVKASFQYSAQDVVDRYNSQNRIESILGGYGYYAGSQADYLRHPNNDSQDSVHLIGDNMSYHFGAGDPLRGKGCGKDNCCFLPFGVITEMYFHGDFMEAVKTMAREMGMDGRRQETQPVAVPGVPGVPANPANPANPAVPAEVVPYTGPVAQQQCLNMDMNRFPLPIRTFVSDLAARNDMIAPICHFGAAYATLGHLIGKVMRADEKGAPYYPNLWVVCLAETGGGKTGAITPIETEIREMGTLMSGGTMAAMFDVVGNTITKKDWLSLSEEQRAEKQREFNRNARLKLTGNYLISDECTGLLNSLMGGWDSKNPAKDIEALLKLADSASYIPKHLSGEGYKIMADCCVSFLGYTQNETWQNKFGGEQFKNCGLFGRFIPLTGRGMRLSQIIPPQGSSYKTVMDEVHEAARLAGQQIRCSFLNPDGGDFIKDAKKRMTDWEWVKKLTEIYPRDWANLQNKIVIHAIKCSMIDAFLNRDYLDGLSIKPCINASCYFETHMKWISAAYWFYLQQSEAVSTTAKHEQIVLSLLKKYQSGMTKRDIARRLNIFGSELAEILDALKDDGQVSVSQRINRNGTKTAVYRINHTVGI